VSGSTPLDGVRAVVTRARSQAGALSRLLRDAGAEVVELPTIELREPDDWGPADAALERLGSYRMAIFTSANGVERFLGRLEARGGQPGDLGDLRLAAIGPSTAGVLTAHGLTVELIPKEYRAEAVLEAAAAMLGLTGERTDAVSVRVLIPRALEAREVLPDGLRALGAEVDVVPVYRTVLPEDSRSRCEEVFGAGVDLITFTSSSTVRNFVRMAGADRVGALLRDVVVASIGPITAETAREAGIGVDIQPEEYTVEGLTGSVTQFFRERRTRG